MAATVPAAVTAKQERTENLDGVLVGLTSMRGVTAAAVVDGDGFVVHVRRGFEIDTDALGAAVQVMFGAARQSAGQVGQGTAELVVSENKDGLVILAPLGKGLVLCVVGDKSAMLGAVRFEIKEAVPQLNRALS